jgi:hypothetical protein
MSQFFNDECDKCHNFSNVINVRDFWALIDLKAFAHSPKLTGGLRFSVAGVGRRLRRFARYGGHDCGVRLLAIAFVRGHCAIG